MASAAQLSFVPLLGDDGVCVGALEPICSYASSRCNVDLMELSRGRKNAFIR